METRLSLSAVVLAVSLVLAAVAPAPLGAIESAEAGTNSCEQAVTHDAFRTDAALEAVNETGSATSRVSNTKAVVEDDSAFIRLRLTNPNGYCVAYSVEISPEIVEAADLGKISSNSDDYEADWRAAQNLSSGAVYTRVTVTLPAGSNATFAPSNARVKSLAWTGEAKRKSGGLFDGLPSLFGDEKLEQRTYEVNATKGPETRTIPLSQDGQRIDSWQATYTVNDETRPVTQDAKAAVYYTERGDSVTFHFNDRDATVSFTAEPRSWEKIGHSWTGYKSGFSSGSSLWPFALIPGGSA